MNTASLRYLTLIFFLTQITYGQTASGTIAGTVLDSTGAAIPNADVSAENALGGERRTVKTGPNGAFRIENIPPSTYNLTVTANGFSRKDVTGINVTASTVTSENVTMEVGATQQIVEVSAGTALIQTDSGELSQTVSTMEIEKLPNRQSQSH